LIIEKGYEIVYYVDVICEAKFYLIVFISTRELIYIKIKIAQKMIYIKIKNYLKMIYIKYKMSVTRVLKMGIVRSRY
jgi:hypothetical protein